VHGRTRVAVLVIAVLCAFPAVAAAAQMPTGIYDTQLTGGSLDLGVLPPLPAIPSSPSFPLTIGTSPLSAQAAGFTLPAQSFNENVGGLGTVAGSYTITLQSLAISLDPTTGSATIDTGAYGTITLTSPLSGSCTVASSSSPLTLHLSTASGSPWDATTNLMTLADKTFTLPSLSCDPSLSLIASALQAYIGGTNPGDNALTMIWSLVRRQDTTNTTGGSNSGGSGGTGGTQQTGGTTNQTGSTAPTGTAPKGCVVPKLKGKRFATKKSLRRLKTRLRKAGCRLGKVKYVKSKKRKGLVIKQSPRPGKHARGGTRVAVTIARGK
jgi:PASTA domain